MARKIKFNVNWFHSIVIEHWDSVKNNLDFIQLRQHGSILNIQNKIYILRIVTLIRF